MPTGLTDEQNEYARRLIRELYAQRKEAGEENPQERLGEELGGVHQSTVSALAKVGSTRGTTMPVLIAAARLAGRPAEEIAQIAGIPVAVADSDLKNDAERAPTSPEAIFAAVARVERMKRTSEEVLSIAREACMSIDEEDLTAERVEYEIAVAKRRQPSPPPDGDTGPTTARSPRPIGPRTGSKRR